MRVYQFREFREDFHNLIGTLTTGCNDHDISFGLFGYSMLQHSLSGSERTRNKSGTALYNRIQCINHTHTRLKQFIGTRFLSIVHHCFLNRPLLNHIHRNIITFLVGQDSNCIFNGIFTFFYN